MITRRLYLINALQIVIDLLIIVLVVYFTSDKAYSNILFLSYIICFWVTASFFSEFYKVYRYTLFLRLLNLTVRQGLFFTLGYFAFFGVFREGDIINNQMLILFSILGLISLKKIIAYFILKKYRSLGKDNKKIIVIGFDRSTKKTINLFNNKPGLGYNFLGFFSDKKHEDSKYLGEINESFKYAQANNINEIYASAFELKKEQIKIITKFANQHRIQLKLIPNPDELFSKSRTVEFYDDTIKILSVRKLPFELYESRTVKRIFDVLFSSLVILFLMSWLTPILWVLIKLESKGALFFKQEREGLNGQKFMCYKFRSMKKNNLQIHASKNDLRVTKIGAFIRKTSIDELPQFFNVLFGDMSVVGPRPHMVSHTNMYAKKIDKFMVRHFVKPGITGLAQISGFRGEVESDKDIIGRVKYDIFYIENWSLLLDTKIIAQTFLNAVKGEDKAY